MKDKNSNIRVVDFQAKAHTTLDGTSEEVLEEGRTAVLNETVVIGYDEAGDLFWSTNTGNAPLLLFMLEQVKHQLMNEFVVEAP